MRLGKRTRRDQEIADLRRQIEEACGVVDTLTTAVAKLGDTVHGLAVGLGRAQGVIDELEPRIEQLESTPAADDVELGPPYDAGQPEPAVEEKYPPATPDENARAAAEAQTIALEPQLTEKQQALVTAVNTLRSASTGDIARYVGRDGEGDAVSMALQKLKRLGHVAHNGRRAGGARWLALANAPTGAPVDEPTAPPRRAPAPPAAEPAVELTDLDERIIRVVEQHGPCTHVYVADNLVKNRRETGARMRELARNGLLVDLDGAFATPDLADAA